MIQAAWQYTCTTGVVRLYRTCLCQQTMLITTIVASFSVTKISRTHMKSRSTWHDAWASAVHCPLCCMHGGRPLCMEGVHYAWRASTATIPHMDQLPPDPPTYHLS